MSRPTVIIHTLDHARAALAAARGMGAEIEISSAPGAAATLGAGVFREMIDLAREMVPGVPAHAVLDCGNDPGLALNALRLGLEAVRLDAPDTVRAKVADIAAQCRAELLGPPDGAPLDLLDSPDPEKACRDWLRSQL